MIFVACRSTVSAVLSLSLLASPVYSQTYSSCNPITQGGCPADPALAKSINVDFTRGASTQFSASGSPVYGSDGAQFTIARSGDSPTISSNWYIMFGHVEFVLRAAPGTGIVSSAILQSDALDEIDFEWLGGDDNQVQSNYFGKGQTVTGYNRGAFHGASGNHDQFHTYTIDWTKDQIVWQVDGNTVRKLTPADAEANQYPQTPMMIKVGIWAGGDPANSPGTITWAGGQTDYTQGPYSMYLKSIKVQDYSTGTSYSYSGTAGTWESINSNGGVIYTGSSGKDTPTVGETPAISTASGAPIPLTTDAAASSVYATRTGYPWIVATDTIITTTSPAPYTTIAGLPSGWSISNSGKVVPPSTGSIPYPSTSYSAASSLESLSVTDIEVSTFYDQRGFPTTVTLIMTPTAETPLTAEVSVVTSFDQQGFPILVTTTATIPGQQSTLASESSIFTPSTGDMPTSSGSILFTTFTTESVQNTARTTVSGSVTLFVPGITEAPQAVAVNSAVRYGSHALISIVMTMCSMFIIP